MAADDLTYHKEIVGRVIAHLVKHGLRRTDLEPADFLEIMVETRGDEEDAIATFTDVLHWMNGEHLIRFSSSQALDVGEVFNGVQLTSRSIAIIKQPQESLGGSIQDVVANTPGGVDRDLASRIADALGSFIGGVAKSVASGG